MVDTLYIEQAVLELETTAAVVSRYPKARQIVIDRYGEVFNSHAQNFRTQKQNPSLILAEKQNAKVMPAPAQYETGGGAHYYFSHMLNCVYDCRYCFLQGMLRSANYLLFVNYQSFIEEIKRVASRHVDDEKPVWFFSGYDCDSLAYEPVTRFAETFVPAFEDIPNAVLELRTKSTQVRSLLAREPINNVVVAYSLSPEPVAAELEQGAPTLAKRLDALKKLQDHGWRIGIRFDPVVWHAGYEQTYAHAIDSVFAALDPERIDSVTLGGFRLPKGFFKTMLKLYPEHWLFNAGLSEQAGLVSYQPQLEREVLDTVAAQCRRFVSPDKLFVYYSDEAQQNQP